MLNFGRSPRPLELDFRKGAWKGALDPKPACHSESRCPPQMRGSRRLFCSNRSRPCTRTRGHRSPIFDFKLLNAMLVDGDCKWLAIQPLTALLELRRETASHPGRAEISENRGVSACFGGQTGHTMGPVRNPARRKWYIERSKKHSKEGASP